MSKLIKNLELAIMTDNMIISHMIDQNEYLIRQIQTADQTNKILQYASDILENARIIKFRDRRIQRMTRQIQILKFVRKYNPFIKK